MKFTNDANMNFSSLKGEFPITFAELLKFLANPSMVPMLILTRPHANGH